MDVFCQIRKPCYNEPSLYQLDNIRFCDTSSTTSFSIQVAGFQEGGVMSMWVLHERRFPSLPPQVIFRDTQKLVASDVENLDESHPCVLSRSGGVALFRFLNCALADLDVQFE